MATFQAPAVPAEGSGALRGGGRLPRSFFSRPASVVAPDLLDRVLVRDVPDVGRLATRIVETEAYEPDDPASHGFRGKTPRNAVMFGPPGHLYVYFTYGMHFCMNVVTGRPGEGSAVLLRAGEPKEGLEEMGRRRGRADPSLLCSGPARWCQALGVDRDLDGEDLVRGSIMWIEGRGVPGEIAVGPRIGIRAGRDRDWRFWLAGDPFVSRGRPTAAETVTPRTR